MIRVATWNMKQAVAPKKPLPELWEWMETEIDPDVIVLTEARIPKEGLPVGWTAIWTPGGIGPRRTWGTIVAAREIELKETKFKRNPKRRKDYVQPHPATLHTADIVIDGDTWATIVGAYGFMPEESNGWRALIGITNECIDLLDGGNERVILAGDFNLWPEHLVPIAEENLGLVDLMGHVIDLPELKGAVGGSRIWTHKNGNSPNAARQELDFIFATDELADEVSAVGGGIDDFPDAWDVSDHAPVVVDFDS